MNNHFGRQRLGYNPYPLAKDLPALKTVEPSHLQENAATLQPQSGAEPEYTVPVDEIRARLHVKGIEKSKDTIQRYCREGQVDAVKQGMFKRYFATEKSVLNLVEKLSNDPTVTSYTQFDAPARKSSEGDLQLHTAVDEDLEIKNIEPDAPARSGRKLDEGTESLVEKMYEKQLEAKDKQIEFLQEELIDRRSATKALEKLVEAFKTNSDATLLNAQTEQRRMEDRSKPMEPNYTVKNANPETDGRERD